MSADRKLWNIALSALMFTGTACGVAVGRQGVEGTGTPVSTPTKTAEPIDTIFEQTNCTKAGVSIPKPTGWTVLEVSISPTFVNCYVSRLPITREEDFRSGFLISKLDGPIQVQERNAYARQLASVSQPSNGLLFHANTFKETTVGSFRIFSGRFTNTDNRILSDEERKIILPDRSNIIYIAHFIAAKPTSDDDFKKYGRNMLDGIRINGQPTR